MAAGAGRDMTILQAGVAIAGIRTKTFTINNTPIDITSGEDTGVRQYLLNAGETALIAGERNIDVSFDGVTKDDALIAAAANNTATVAERTLRMASGATIVGKFALTNLTLTGEMADAQTFSGELHSTDTWTYTAAP